MAVHMKSSDRQAAVHDWLQLAETWHRVASTVGGEESSCRSMM
jgi:hypothetical protein